MEEARLEKERNKNRKPSKFYLNLSKIRDFDSDDDWLFPL